MSLLPGIFSSICRAIALALVDVALNSAKTTDPRATSAYSIAIQTPIRSLYRSTANFLFFRIRDSFSSTLLLSFSNVLSFSRCDCRAGKRLIPFITWSNLLQSLSLWIWRKGELKWETIEVDQNLESRKVKDGKRDVSSFVFLYLCIFCTLDSSGVHTWARVLCPLLPLYNIWLKTA